MDGGAEFDEVIAAARSGGEWAIALLYRDLHPRLLRYLRAHDRDGAEDLASDVWIELARGLAPFEGTETGLRGLMFTIARRRLADQRRNRGRRRTDSTAPEALHDIAGADDVAGAALDSIDAQAAVDVVRSVLSPDQAEVVLLRVLGGLEVAQVAEIMGKRPGTVRVLQHRALGTLAEHFREDL